MTSSARHVTRFAVRFTPSTALSTEALWNQMFVVCHLALTASGGVRSPRISCDSESTSSLRDQNRAKMRPSLVLHTSI